MKKQAKLLAVCSLTMITSVGLSQGYMAQSQAAINMQGSLNNQMAPPGNYGPAPVPGQVPGVGNPGMGYAPGAMGGNTMPGMGMTDPAMAGMEPGMGGMPGMTGVPGQTAAYAAPTPIPSENVLTGRRVYDAVSGGLLEDAVEIAVRQSDVEVFPDDGINDNGIAGDGVRGNVRTSKNQFIGQFSNVMKKYLIHAVDNAEQIDPMVYYGYHIAKVEPTHVEGLKRYGLPLNEEAHALATPNVEPDFASVIDLERDRDDVVRRWNYEFLAEYRVTPSDPQSEYYPVFVPSPPLTPTNYPVPTGYVAPQAAALATQKQLDVAAQEQAAQAASSAASSRGSGGGGGGGMPGML